MRSWPVQDAKARFSEFLDASQRDGPQIVTRRGVETAVLAPVSEWNRLRESAPQGLKKLLLAASPRHADLAPRRRLIRRRPVVQFPSGESFRYCGSQPAAYQQRVRVRIAPHKIAIKLGRIVTIPF